MSNIFAVIMAGGRGERFWPQSRMSHPKQLLRLIGSLTLIEQTVGRLDSFIPPENIIVITNEEYVQSMHSLLKQLPPENIIGEPIGRDTGACIALATALVKTRATVPNPIMITLPSDHLIRDIERMQSVLKDCVAVASEGEHIVTIGIKPTYASTGYGYIKCKEVLSTNLSTTFYKGEKFIEKPSAPIAQKLLDSGAYKWNSGMFIWSLETITNALEKHAPELYKLLNALEKADCEDCLMDSLEPLYKPLSRTSIDYAIMEKVDNIIIADATFDWNDVGSWNALRSQIRPRKNNTIVQGLYESVDSSDCIIVGNSQHLIATVGVKDLIVVHTDDATLVCNVKSAQRVKELVQLLGDEGSSLTSFL